MISSTIPISKSAHKRIVEKKKSRIEEYLRSRISRTEAALVGPAYPPKPGTGRRRVYSISGI
jgi:hypothetical protein